MASKKKYNYVLVFTEKGPVYVTGTGEHHIAYWNDTGKPKHFENASADDVALGLNLNGFNAVKVVMPYEIEHQPYAYKDGFFRWIKKMGKTGEKS